MNAQRKRAARKTSGELWPPSYNPKACPVCHTAYIRSIRARDFDGDVCFDCWRARYTNEPISRFVIGVDDRPISIRLEGNDSMLTVTPKWGGRIVGKPEWLIGIGDGATITAKDEQVQAILGW